MKATREQIEQVTNVSRRNFFKFTAGMLVTLPTVVGGYLVPATLAYAATTTGGEVDGGDELENVTRITMVSASQVGVVVADAATGGKTRVANAHVTLTSRYNGKKLEGTSDADGEVLFDIRNLAENPDNKNVDELDEYGFNGSLTVTADGYREFATALIRVEGGNGFMAPTRTIDDNSKPYPRQVSFDEWDILYSKSAFIISTKNATEHTISAEIWNLGSGQATVAIKKAADNSTLLTTNGTPSGSKLTVTYKGKYLLKGDAAAFPVTGDQDDLDNDQAYEAFYLDVVQGKAHYTWPIHFMSYEGVVDEPTEQKDASLAPLNTTNTSKTGLDITLPKDLPVVGGSSIKSFMPDFYFNLSLNPFGYLQFTAKTPSLGYHKDNGGGDNKQGWGMYPRSSVKSQFEKAFNKVNDMQEKAADAQGGQKLIKPIKSFGSIDCSAYAQIILVAQWSTKKHFFEGIIGGQIFVVIDTSYSWDFWFGYIPITATIAFNMTSIIGLTGGAYTSENVEQSAIEAAANFGDWHMDYSNTGLTITFNLMPSFSFGVGVSGIASVGARARFILTMSFGVAFKNNAVPAGQKELHEIFGWSADISVELKFFLYTAAIPLFKWSQQPFYDNWKGGVQPYSAMSSQDDDSTDGMAELIDRMSIITTAQLAATNEFTKPSSLTGQADDVTSEREVFNWEDMRLDDIQAPLDDGTVITYAVYRIVPEDEFNDMVSEEVADGEAETEAAPEAVEGTAASETEMTTSSEDEEAAASVEAAAAAASLSALSDTGASAVDSADGALVAQAEGADVAATGIPLGSDNTAADQGFGIGNEQQVDGNAAEQPGDGQAVAETTETAPSEQGSIKKSVLHRLPDEHVFESARGGAAIDESGFFAMDESNNTILMDPEVGGLGVEGGIRPSSDKVIAKNVMGDPRVKIVDMHTDTDGVHLRVTCSFRIGTVTIDDEVRTRVIMTVIDADSNLSDVSALINTSRPLDFPIDSIDGITHADLYDYEFDLAFTSSGDSDMVHLVVVSGKRDGGDLTEFADVATNLVFSYVNFHVSDAFGGRPMYAVRSMPASQALGTDDGKYHTISNVKCATDGTDESSIVLIGFLDGSADTPSGLFEGKYGISNTRVGLAAVNQDEGKWIVADPKTIDAAMGFVEESGIHRLTLSPKIGDSYTVSLASVDKTYFFVLHLDADSGVLTSIKQADALNDALRLLPWPKQNCFLTSFPSADYIAELEENGDIDHPEKWDHTKYMLQTARWDESGSKPVLSFEAIGPNNFNIENFGINNSGTFIFWPQTRVGGEDRRIYDDTGAYETIKDEDSFQLMACRVHNGIFSEPFIAADLPHDLTSIEIVASRDNTAPLEVLSVAPLQESNGGNGSTAVDVWYTAIPHVKCATAIGCLAPIPFVSPGGKLLFDIAIRNDGNSYLAGCTVQMYEHSSKTDEKPTEVSGSVGEIVFGADTLVESHYNPIVDGEFQNVEDDFALPPGKRSIYRVRIPIPEGWSGDKYVSFVASKPVLAKDGGLTSMAEEENVYKEFSIGPGEYRPLKNSATSIEDHAERNMTIVSVLDASAQGESLADAPLSYEIAEDDSGGYSGGGNGGGKGGNGSRREALPMTGDFLSGEIAAGLAMAGAALAAYGRRRARVEAEEENENK